MLGDDALSVNGVPVSMIAGYARLAFLERKRSAAAGRVHEPTRLTRPSSVRYACLGAG
jgi:hypothetical protein